jgi:transposase
MKFQIPERKFVWFEYRRGKSYREIAESLGLALRRRVTRNTISGIIHRVRHNPDLQSQFNKEFENGLRPNP